MCSFSIEKKGPKLTKVENESKVTVITVETIEILSINKFVILPSDEEEPLKDSIYKYKYVFEEEEGYVFLRLMMIVKTSS